MQGSRGGSACRLRSAVFRRVYLEPVRQNGGEGRTRTCVDVWAYMPIPGGLEPPSADQAPAAMQYTACRLPFPLRLSISSTSPKSFKRIRMASCHAIRLETAATGGTRTRILPGSAMSRSAVGLRRHCYFADRTRTRLPGISAIELRLHCQMVAAAGLEPASPIIPCAPSWHV